MKLAYTLALAGLVACHVPQLHAQWVPDTAHSGANYVNDVYYSLPNGTVSAQPRSNWHIGLGTNTGSSIIVNHGANVRVYRTSYDTAHWAFMDPIGQLVDDNEIFNTESNWYAGAFNSTADPTDPFDIGWAVYTMMGSGAYPAHSIIGDSLYYVETPEGTYRLWLKYRIPGGIYSLTYQSEDVGTPNTITFDLDDYADASTNPARKKNFIYVNFNTGQVVDREPYSDEWDLLFTRYLAPQPNGTLYPVSGVKLNVNRQVAEFAHIDVNSIDTTGASWSLDATYIGSDWKAFNGQQFVITDSLCWAVKAHDGSVWVLYFDYFPGSGSGAYGLQKRQLAVVGSPGTLGSPRIGIFPNPATTSLHLVVDAHAPAQGSLEIRDMSGRVVYSAAVHLPGGLVPITLMGLDIVPGVYSLVLTANGQCVSQRVVFQR